MNIKDHIIYEDNHLIAIDKPAGILVQGDKTGDMPLSDMVKQYIKHKYKKPGDVFLGVIHRIDRPVSGAVIFGRTSKALERMNKLFAEGKIDKKYYAITEGRPTEFSNTLTHFLLKDRDRNVVKAQRKPSSKHSKKSITHYNMLNAIDGKSLLEVRPVTGRSHQIRVQLAANQTVISGDLKYGATKALPDACIALHCSSMEFIHPVKKEKIKIASRFPSRYPFDKFKNSIA